MLLVGDLHLTSVPRDAYRWDIFPQIKRALEAGGDEELVLLGDLTDRKDNHPSELVNRICDELARVAKTVKVVHVLRGNHDGIDPGWPYFRFLGHLSKVRFYSEPTLGSVDGVPALFLPHSRNPTEDWSAVDFGRNTARHDVIFAHVTVDGASAENRQELSGPPASVFEGVPVYAGDVHVPQRVGSVTYVGAPYPIRFGDSFAGRFIRLSSKLKATAVETKSIHRLLLDVDSADGLDGSEARKGDQAKVRVHLSRSNLHTWNDERKAVAAWASKAGIELVAVELVCEEEKLATRRLRSTRHTVDDLLAAYVRRNGIDESLAEVGSDLLRQEAK